MRNAIEFLQCKTIHALGNRRQFLDKTAQFASNALKAVLEKSREDKSPRIVS
jgi:hypothetical protein